VSVEGEQRIDGCTEFARGCELFDGGDYWLAHEAFEHAWHALPHGSVEAELARALAQLAAAFVQIERGGPAQCAAAARCLVRCEAKLERLPIGRVEALAGAVRGARAAVETGATVVPPSLKSLRMGSTCGH
jgi:hypothetical protein